MSDPAFLAEAAQLQLEIEGKGGAELQRVIEELLTTPADVLKQVAAAIEVKGAQERR